MGTSTDAILAFGFDLGDEVPERLQSATEDFENWIGEQAGLVWVGGMEDAVAKAFWAARHEAVHAYPVDLITHCSYDYPMFFLAVRGTEMKARRGDPVEISTPEISETAIAAMRSFCDEHGIEWREPKWHIFSLWG